MLKINVTPLFMRIGCFLIWLELRKNKEAGPSGLSCWCLYFILFSVCAKPSIFIYNITKNTPAGQENSKKTPQIHI